MKSYTSTYEEIWVNLIAVCGADFKTAEVIIAYTDCIAEICEAMITLATLGKASYGYHYHGKKKDNLFHIWRFLYVSPCF